MGLPRTGTTALHRLLHADPHGAGAGDVADAVPAAAAAARDLGVRPDLHGHADGVHRAPRREPRVHGHPLHGCHDRRGVLAAAAADRQVQLLRVAGQPAALHRVAAGPGLDRRLRAPQAEPAAGRPQRPREALGAQEPVAHDRARRADGGLSRRADRLHPPRPGHLHRLVVLALGGDDGRPLRDLRRRRHRPHPARPVVAVLPRLPRRPARRTTRHSSPTSRSRSCSPTRSAPPAGIYEQFGLDWTPEVQTAIEEIDRESKQGSAKPSHKYELKDYGLTEDQVRAAFDR